MHKTNVLLFAYPILCICIYLGQKLKLDNYKVLMWCTVHHEYIQFVES